jgi:hypothetical protein
MISVMCGAGNRNRTASLIMEWYDVASKQRLVWRGTLYIYDPISLLALSMSVARKRLLYTTCLFVLQLTF